MLTSDLVQKMMDEVWDETSIADTTTVARLLKMQILIQHLDAKETFEELARMNQRLDNLERKD